MKTDFYILIIYTVLFSILLIMNYSLRYVYYCWICLLSARYEQGQVPSRKNPAINRGIRIRNCQSAIQSKSTISFRKSVYSEGAHWL